MTICIEFPGGFRGFYVAENPETKAGSIIATTSVATALSEVRAQVGLITEPEVAARFREIVESLSVVRDATPIEVAAWLILHGQPEHEPVDQWAKPLMTVRQLFDVATGQEVILPHIMPAFATERDRLAAVIAEHVEARSLQ